MDLGGEEGLKALDKLHRQGGAAGDAKLERGSLGGALFSCLDKAVEHGGDAEEDRARLHLRHGDDGFRLEMGKELHGEAEVHGDVHHARDAVDVIERQSADDDGIRLDGPPHPGQYCGVAREIPWVSIPPLGSPVVPEV